MASDAEQKQHLLTEINELAAQQDVALKAAAYLPMTPGEAKEYDRRSERKAELITELEHLSGGGDR